MNIFKILSSNAGRINEPNISSFLAYLLDPNEDHGLSTRLLDLIVDDYRAVDSRFFKNLGSLSNYRIEIKPEYKVFSDSEKCERKKRFIDIVVGIYENNEKFPKYALCIENKIKDFSIQNNQLKEELDWLKKDDCCIGDETEIYFCFITRRISGKAEKAFEKQLIEVEKKMHLSWMHSNSDKRDSLQKKLLRILKEEQNGDIDPISSESKYLLKSFVTFIHAGFRNSAAEKEERNEQYKYGRPIIEFIRDYVNSMKSGAQEKRSDIIDKILKMISPDCIRGKSTLRTINAQLYKAVVNAPVRLDYGITPANHEKYDLLFYPDSKSTEIVQKYEKNDERMKDVNIIVEDE